MNSLTPKVNRESANRPKNKIGSPIVIKSYEVNPDAKYNSVNNFINSASADDQLAILKCVIEEQKNLCDQNVVKFLAVVFYEAPAKHPVKCFLTRHVTKCTSIQRLFIELLSAHITEQLTGTEDKSFSSVVPKLVTCIENFQSGAAAVKTIDYQLAEYLIECFNCCFRALRISSLSPTKKNEIFTLEHSALRLLVHIVQKLNKHTDSECTWNLLFKSMKSCIEQLIVDEDVPMDTKCLSGILLLCIENWMSNGHAWMMMLTATSKSYSIMQHKAGQLAAYSAIATSVTMEELQRPVENNPAILMLLNKLLSIAESAASEPALTLGVGRSFLLLSRCLDIGTAAGPLVADSLLVFVWAHLEFYLDSVRHLAQQVLANVLDACARAEATEPFPLASLLSRVRALGRCRGFYWCVGRAAAALGPGRALRDLCPVGELLDAATIPHLQAAACSAISAVLSEQARTSAEVLFAQWVRAALERVDAADVTSLPPLEAVLAQAVRLQPAVVPYICEYMTSAGCSVRVSLVCCRAAAACREHLPRDVLYAAAVAAADETRILCLSVCAESERSTAPLAAPELRFVLWFLRYNINAASPNFRQLMLAHMKKLLKRLEDGYRVLQRSDPTSGQHYIQFMEDLRELCYKSVLRGANFGRRSAALQLLVVAERLQLPGYKRIWKEEHVETLLLHLDDSYESNKALALQVLECCPDDMLQTDRFSASISLPAVCAQAAALRPAESLSAAYKLRLLLARRPDLVCTADPEDLPDEAAYTALSALVGQVRAETGRCARRGVAAAAARGAMFGALHCLACVLRTPRLRGVTWEGRWSALAHALAAACEDAADSVRPVVCAASPEGFLPRGSEVLLEGGGHVTAQMVLICAWRTIKEACGVLAALVSLVPAARSRPLVERCGALVVTILCSAQHRGAVEQAAVHLAHIATRCWWSPALAALPRGWLRATLDHVTSGARLPATRRGAGLPFILQALVTTELQTTGRGDSFLACMSALLEHAAPAPPAPAPPAPAPAPAPDAASGAERRALCANALRALYRHTALEHAVQPHVAAGLHVALAGFDARGWSERTAMCLLLSALAVRVFGVQRARAALDARNKMAARVFFARYPPLYDLMLSKLEAMEPQSPRPSPFPTLLLLARLYPSAQEGAASNLKLAPFLPLVARCACSGVLHTRRAAARALAALLAPSQYYPQVSRLLSQASSRAVPRNHLHGVLLQLASLLDSPPLTPRAELAGVQGTLWILDQPCYVITREYVGVLNLLLWRFPESISNQTASNIKASLEQMLFIHPPPPVATGRDLCLQNCLYLLFILLHKDKNIHSITKLIEKTLQHKSYEVVLAALNYLLVLHEDLDPDDCKFLEHLSDVRDESVLDGLRESCVYVERLGVCLHESRYVECRHKCLRLLTLERDTQRRVVNDMDAGDEQVVRKLIDLIDSGHENITHLYLDSLVKFVGARLAALGTRLVLQVLRAVFVHSSADNSDAARGVVVSWLERDADTMMDLDLNMGDADKFEYKATIICTLVTLLEDDDDGTRQRAADVAARLARDVTLAHVTLAQGGVASACAELLRTYLERVEDSAAMFVALALLDFNCEVVMMDELTDECRVFDQSERYNIFLEETVWTCACAEKIIQTAPQQGSLTDYVLSIIHNDKYARALENLCKHNLLLFKEMANGTEKNDETINPKIELFLRKLRG